MRPFSRRTMCALVGFVILTFAQATQAQPCAGGA